MAQVQVNLDMEIVHELFLSMAFKNGTKRQLKLVQPNSR